MWVITKHEHICTLTYRITGNTALVNVWYEIDGKTHSVLGMGVPWEKETLTFTGESYKIHAKILTGNYLLVEVFKDSELIDSAEAYGEFAYASVEGTIH